MNISYFLRDNNAKKPQRIWAFFRYNKEAFKIDTNQKIEPSNWLKGKQRVSPSAKNADDLNTYLKGFSDNLEKLILKLQNQKTRIDKYRIQEEIDRLYKNNKAEKKEGEVYDFISFVDEYIKMKSKTSKTRTTVLKQCRVNIILAFNLADKKQIDAYKKLNNKEKGTFLLQTNRPLDFDRIDLTFLEKFNEYLHSATYQKKKNGKYENEHYTKNYIGKQIKILKQFIGAAIAKKHVESFERTSVKAITEDVDSVYTDYNDLQQFLNLDLSNYPSEQLARDKYVFNCYLGLRVSDLNAIKRSHFSEQEINGKNHFVYCGRNKKTDIKIEFVLHPTALAILHKYEFQFPYMDDNTYNECLKMVAMKAGLTYMVRKRETRGTKKVELEIPKYKLISSHTGRRSFCTNFYRSGIATRAIMSVSGHKSEAEFLKYISKDATVDVGVVAAQIATIKELTIAA